MCARPRTNSKKRNALNEEEASILIPSPLVGEGGSEHAGKFTQPAQARLRARIRVRGTAHRREHSPSPGSALASLAPHPPLPREVGCFRLRAFINCQTRVNPSLAGRG